jgi:hypothetical protein
MCTIWTPISLVVFHILLFSIFLSSWTHSEPESTRIRGERENNQTYSPTLSPTFVVPVTVMYLSQRAVRGDFIASGETPESICKEKAYELYACSRVAPLISAWRVSLRKRAREMKNMMVSYEHRGVIAHEIAEIWSPEFKLNSVEEIWTGSNADGSTAEDRCLDWTSTSGYGVVGSIGISDGEQRCVERRRLLCVCKTLMQ